MSKTDLFDYSVLFEAAAFCCGFHPFDGGCSEIFKSLFCCSLVLLGDRAIDRRLFDEGAVRRSDGRYSDLV